MRIDTLRLKNFRCFEDQEFNFHPEMNVLVGQNGAGKTAVLEALAIAIGTWLLGIGGYTSRTIRPVDVRLRPIQLDGRVIFEGQYPVSVEAIGIVDDSPVRWQRVLAGAQSHTSTGDASDLRKYSTQADKSVRAGESVTLPVIAYYGSGRLWRELRDTSGDAKGISKRELSRLEGYRDCIDGRISPNEMMRWIERLDRIAYQERIEQPLLGIVTTTMRRMLEGCVDIQYDAKRADVVAYFANDESMLFKNLSDGRRNLLSLAGDLSMRMARLNPHLATDVLNETPGVVLIDELDLHLHPRWQRCVVDDLRTIFPKVQFIASTHSPFIVQTLQEGELINMDGQPVPEFGNLSINTIAQGLMGVEHPEVSPRYLKMVNNAKSYLEMLREAKDAPGDQRRILEEQLMELIAPYADNPAYQAFLEMERVAALGR